MTVELTLRWIVAMAAIALVVATGAVLFYLRRRGESRRALKARVVELQNLSDAVGAIASSSLDEAALYQLVYERAAKLVDVTNFQLGMYESDCYTIMLRYANGVKQPAQSFDISDVGGIVGWMRDTGKPLLVKDFLSEMATLPAQPRYVSQNPPRSAVFVPMRASEEVIGAMAIQSPNVASYTDSHLRLLGIIANQAAAAIQNARALSLERTRARQLELVHEVARSTVSIFELKPLLERVVTSIKEAFGYYFVGIFLLNDLKQLECVAATTSGAVGFRVKLGEGLVGRCAADNAPVVANDIKQEPQFVDFSDLPDTKSEAVMPLWNGNRVIGVLDLQSDQANAFSRVETRYLEILSQEVAVSVENGLLYQASMARQQLEQELLFAREIQTSFLPKHAPRFPGWSVAGAWRAARQVGGDFYDFIGPLEDERWGVVIADVADKGVPAALFMSLSRTIMRAVGFSNRPPAEALTRVNKLIHQDTASDLFVTMFYAILNPRDGQICFANGGHNPPIICRAGTETSIPKDHGVALGVLPDAAYEAHTFTLQPGDAFLLYTDGIIDALNRDYEEFGLERLQSLLCDTRDLDAQSIADKIMQAVKDHTGEETPYDDQTLVVLKRDVIATVSNL